jgi:phage head maturation protease
VSYVIQGVANTFDVPFTHNGEVVTNRKGCFNRFLSSNHEIKFLIGHDESHCFGSSRTNLLIHAGARSLVFRYAIPESKQFEKAFAEVAGDIETYTAVSIGYTAKRVETRVVDGVKVVEVLDATLEEISLLDCAPAVGSTYARIVSWDTCSDLQEDYDTGLFELTGRLISLHRAVEARDNGGKINFSHARTPMDRAADNFLKVLRRLDGGR